MKLNGILVRYLGYSNIGFTPGNVYQATELRSKFIEVINDAGQPDMRKSCQFMLERIYEQKIPIRDLELKGASIISYLPNPHDHSWDFDRGFLHIFPASSLAYIKRFDYECLKSESNLVLREDGIIEGFDADLLPHLVLGGRVDDFLRDSMGMSKAGETLKTPCSHTKQKDLQLFQTVVRVCADCGIDLP